MHERWLKRLRLATRALFFLGSVFFFLAAVLQFLRGAGVNADYLVAGALMASAPAVLDWADERFGRR